MIAIHVAEAGGRWYGLACCGDKLVATAAAPTREGALNEVRRALPRGADYSVAPQLDAFATRTIRMLAELEAGHEADKPFSLAPDLVPEHLARVLTVAAAIPLGYVTTYGNIAKAAATEARVVGRVMATNPLYPIVPCHRVVGADFSLVGYGGQTSAAARAAKLARLRVEASACEEERDVPVGAALLRVYPVERVLAKADREREDASRQRGLFDP